jgi:alcohol dehydrogenase
MNPGTSSVVVGLGGVGMNAVLAAVLSGARAVVAMDLVDEKLALAKSLGATHAINAGAPDAIAQAREATGGGADFAFEMAGSVQAMELAYRVTRRGGTTITAGLPLPLVTITVPCATYPATSRSTRRACCRWTS